MIRQNFSLGSLLALLDTAIRFNPMSAPRIVPAQRPAHERYVYKPHSGAREMARRKRFMDRHGAWRTPGALFVMVDNPYQRWTNNSHGEIVRFYGEA
jgi:hypothetical protein